MFDIEQERSDQMILGKCNSMISLLFKHQVKTLLERGSDVNQPNRNFYFPSKLNPFNPSQCSQNLLQGSFEDCKRKVGERSICEVQTGIKSKPRRLMEVGKRPDKDRGEHVAQRHRRGSNVRHEDPFQASQRAKPCSSNHRGGYEGPQ